MAKFTAHLVVRVPIYAELIVEADDHGDAQAQAQQQSFDTLQALKWGRGADSEYAVPFRLHGDDLSTVEIARVAKVDERDLKIAAFHAEHGEAWGVIVNAGYVGETDTGGLFKSQREAWEYVEANYDRDERETLHVDVPHWDAAGRFWSYDH